MKKLGFGLMRLPQKDGAADHEQICAMADAFLANGFTYFDTAIAYGNGASERAFREAVVKRYPREAFTIADKLPLWKLLKEELTPAEVFATTLENLGVDYVDYYLVHAVSDDRVPDLDRLGVWDFMKQLKADGRARHIGFSFHGTPEGLQSLLEAHPEMEFVQLQLNYADWDNPNVQSGRCYEIAQSFEKPVIVMEPIKGGTLANLGTYQAEPLTALEAASPAAYALRFASSLPGVMVVLSGMSLEAQMSENLATFAGELALSDAERAAIDEVRKRLSETPQIGCTGCRYCTEDCPMQIDIPKFFRAYNHYLSFGTFRDAWNEGHGIFDTEDPTPLDCIECYSCAEHCPQHLEIPELLKKIVEAAE